MASWIVPVGGQHISSIWGYCFLNVATHLIMCMGFATRIKDRGLIPTRLNAAIPKRTFSSVLVAFDSFMITDSGTPCSMRYREIRSASVIAVFSGKSEPVAPVIKTVLAYPPWYKASALSHTASNLTLPNTKTTSTFLGLSFITRKSKMGLSRFSYSSSVNIIQIVTNLPTTQKTHCWVFCVSKRSAGLEPGLTTLTGSLAN